MRRHPRHPPSLRFRAATVLIATTMAGLTLAAQSRPSAAPRRTAGAQPAVAALRTPWGDPDLQGYWTNATPTPLERPLDPATATEPNADAPLKAGDPGNYNEFWYERGRRSGSPSLVVDPPDGRIPPFSPAGQARLDAQNASRSGRGPADSWEDRNLYERCITRGMPGAMLPGFYNHNYQIFQTREHVAISVEMIHDVRIVPLDRRPHLGPAIRQWLGDSRGRWDGDTLIVETTNFTDKTLGGNWLVGGGTGGTLKLTERFRRVDADTIDYRFTVDDPTVLSRSWTVSTPMARMPGPIYEYACHEGNYGMLNLLAGNRAEERRKK